MNISTIVAKTRICSTERKTDYIQWPLNARVQHSAFQSLEKISKSLQTYLGGVFILRVIGRTDENFFECLLIAELAKPVLDPEYELNNLQQMISEAQKVLAQVKSSPHSAEKVAIASGDNERSTDLTIFAPAPIAKIANILRNHLPVSDTEIGETGTLLTRTVNACSATIEDMQSMQLKGIVTAVLDSKRQLTLNDELKKSTYVIGFGEQHRLREQILTSQLKRNTITIEVTSSYKLENGVRKDKNFKLQALIEELASTQTQLLI